MNGMAKKTASRWQRLREEYQCQGRIRAEKGARPSFCWRVRGEKTPAGKVHVIQLISRRTGKPIGFINTDYKLDPDRSKAHEWDSLNRFSAEMFMTQSLEEAKDKPRPYYAGSRALIKSIDRAARSKAH